MSDNFTLGDVVSEIVDFDDDRVSAAGIVIPESSVRVVNKCFNFKECDTEFATPVLVFGSPTSSTEAVVVCGDCSGSIVLEDG